jgi:LPS-assembly protein
MQIKNRKKFFVIFFIVFNMLNSVANAEEFNIIAKEVLIDKENQILIGKGSVQAQDTEGKIILADKITYTKNKEFLLAEGNVKITDLEGNILTAEKATYDKINEMIVTFDNTEIILIDGYNLITKNVTYNVGKKIVTSANISIFTDTDGNLIETKMFQYHIKENLFSSVGKIKITDIKKNKYFFKEVHVDTQKKEIVGSDVSIILDQLNFGVSEESDPRIVANDAFISKNKTNLSKGVFTVCKKRDEKCPPWSLKAKKISHDKIKKTIFYENATLKLYDIPIFYFPRFFHPDPTVKRQSGFLAPFFTKTSTVGSGIATPYFWAISEDKDFTFTPKTYVNENPLFLSEYRQAFKNGFLTLDTGFTQGYKNNSTTKKEGTRNHFFADYVLDFSDNKSDQNNFHLKIQRTSNDTYFKKHDINTSLVDSENQNLEDEIRYSIYKDDTFFDISVSAYENLGIDKKSDKYEYVLPNIIFGKTFFTENFGILNFTSNALINKYETNKQTAFLTNDVIWSPSSKLTKNGFINTFEAMFRNVNYEAKKTDEYKNNNTVNELNSVLTYKSSLPLKKNGINVSKLFSPNFMLRYAPGHMRDLSSKDVTLNYTNLYSMNKTSEIEDGLSAILGFDYKINDNEGDREILSLSLGQVFNRETNKDIPSKSSLDQKMSDVVGEFNYNFSNIGVVNYKFSVDHNLSDINYNEISTALNLGMVQFNLDYLEQQNHIGNEHYASPGVTLNFDDKNKLSFSTKKNFKTESTELYNLSYQYALDCLKAGVDYKRTFYQDADIEAKNSLMFTITFVPFTSVSSPVIE